MSEGDEPNLLYSVSRTSILRREKYNRQDRSFYSQGGVSTGGGKRVRLGIFRRETKGASR